MLHLLLFSMEKMMSTPNSKDKLGDKETLLSFYGVVLAITLSTFSHSAVSSNFEEFKPSYYAGTLLAPISATLATTFSLFTPVQTSQVTNAIVLENALPGTAEWEINGSNYASNREIEGYASAVSVNKGEQIKLFVNTGAQDQSYRMTVYRMGWYAGLGGRKIAELKQADGKITFPAVAQSTPSPDPKTGLLEAKWIKPYTLTIPTNWTSGVYLVNLVGEQSKLRSRIIFTVRDDAGKSDYFFQSSVTTYQAYNNWPGERFGGKSLYPFSSVNGQANKVSFNRPYMLAQGAGEFFSWEYAMVQFLEKNGYDISYTTNIDTHARGNLIPSHKVFLSVGHDEYWSLQMREGVEQARAKGVGMAFFSANSMYWQIRTEPGFDGAVNRTMVGYRDLWQADPVLLDTNPSNDKLVTNLWRSPQVNRPEDAFIGVMYNTSFMPTCEVNCDIVVSNADHWIYKNSGITGNGDRLHGLLGYEADSVYGNAPAWISILATSFAPPNESGNPSDSNMTIYTWESGAGVFSSGSMQWNWGVQPTNEFFNPKAVAITNNLLARLAYVPKVTLDAAVYELGDALKRNTLTGTAKAAVTNALNLLSSAQSASAWQSDTALYINSVGYRALHAQDDAIEALLSTSGVTQQVRGVSKSIVYSMKALAQAAINSAESSASRLPWYQQYFAQFNLNIAKYFLNLGLNEISFGDFYHAVDHFAEAWKYSALSLGICVDGAWQ